MVANWRSFCSSRSQKRLSRGPAHDQEETMRNVVHRPAHAVAGGESSWPIPCIQKAHERSEGYGLATHARPDYDILPASELALKVEQNRILCAHAMPVMETLREQIVNTESMVVLTDAQGLILHSIGDDDFLARAEKVALRPGAQWSEDRQGTNAIGTALAERSPTVVHGDQHFLAANHFLTCSSVPILDPYGDLVGVLDVTGDYRSYHQHTMALAKMSVQMIENHLFAATFRDTLQVAFHSRPEFLGTLMEGIAAFTGDGRFLSANRSAQFQLGMPLAALRAHTLSSLFGTTSAELVDRLRTSRDPILSLNLHNGAVVCATGKLIYANPFVKATSVTGYAPDGSPIEDASKYPAVGTTIRTCPSFLGGKNWWSVSYDPAKHLAFVPTLHACMTLSGKSVSYMEGLPYLGEGFEIQPEPGSKGYGELQAIDVDTGKKVWSHWTKMPWNGGVASTAGGLAFSGSLDGHLYAFDEATGTVLWQSPKLASGIIAQPSVFEANGQEYVAVLAGYGGANPIWGGPMAKIADKVPRGGTLYVFALHHG
jgi:PAS domain-containing protein